MKSTIARLVLGIALVDVGWVARAQVVQPEFELLINAPEGETSIECVRGCELMWVERGPNPNSAPQPRFSFACRGAVAQRCSSGRIGGWSKQ